MSRYVGNDVVRHGHIIDYLINSKKHSRIRWKTLVISVIKEYFSMVKENVLNGYEFDFGRSKHTKKNLGSIYIYKERNTKEFVDKLFKRYGNGIKNRYNIGYHFGIAMKSELLEKHDMRFIACDSLKLRLKKMAREKNLDYRSR